jgi:hypothetical protein
VGVEATGQVGTTGVDVTVELAGVGGTGEVGNVVRLIEQALTGVSASGAAGDISVGERLVAITGCEALGQVGSPGVFYWSLIDDAENANWQNIDNSESGDWALIPTQ